MTVPSLTLLTVQPWSVQSWRSKSQETQTSDLGISSLKKLKEYNSIVIISDSIASEIAGQIVSLFLQFL